MSPDTWSHRSGQNKSRFTILNPFARATLTLSQIKVSREKLLRNKKRSGDFSFVSCEGGNITGEPRVLAFHERKSGACSALLSTSRNLRLNNALDSTGSFKGAETTSMSEGQKRV